MIDYSDKGNDPVLTFDGKQYDINSLPDEVKEMIKGLQVADNQLRLYEDTLKILAIGRQSMASQLNNKLKGISPIPNS